MAETAAVAEKAAVAEMAAVTETAAVAAQSVCIGTRRDRFSTKRNSVRNLDFIKLYLSMLYIEKYILLINNLGRFSFSIISWIIPDYPGRGYRQHQLKGGGGGKERQDQSSELLNHC